MVSQKCGFHKFYILNNLETVTPIREKGLVPRDEIKYNKLMDIFIKGDEKYDGNVCKAF